MSENNNERTYAIEEALRAQKALRDLAGLEPETFPVEAFVGMISDEIETLRKKGFTNEKIADVIRSNSAIRISASEIEENYATPEERHGGHP